MLGVRVLSHCPRNAERVCADIDFLPFSDQFFRSCAMSGVALLAENKDRRHIALQKWLGTQDHMREDLEVTPTRFKVWQLQRDYVGTHTSGFTLNLGAGNSDIGADVNIDPLVHRDVVGVGEYLPFRGVFNAVLILSVLDHVLDDCAVLREASRVLAPGGRVVVMQTIQLKRSLALRIRATLRFLFRRQLTRVFWDPDSLLCLPNWDYNHMRHYRTMKELLKPIHAAGFNVIDSVTDESFGYPIIFATLSVA